MRRICLLTTGSILYWYRKDNYARVSITSLIIFDTPAYASSVPYFFKAVEKIRSYTAKPHISYEDKFEIFKIHLGE